MTQKEEIFLRFFFCSDSKKRVFFEEVLLSRLLLNFSFEELSWRKLDELVKHDAHYSAAEFGYAVAMPAWHVHGAGWAYA